MAKKNQPPNSSKSEQHMGLLDSMPSAIDTPISGLDAEELTFVNRLIAHYHAGADIFQTHAPHHEDWAILFVLLDNDAQNRATVTKNIVEVTGRAYGTVRASLQRFESLGYISSRQKIGRSELYVPTVKLKEAIRAVAQKYEDDKNE